MSPKIRRHYTFRVLSDLAEEWSEFQNAHEGDTTNEKFNDMIRRLVHKPTKEEWLKSMHACNTDNISK